MTNHFTTQNIAIDGFQFTTITHSPQHRSLVFSIRALIGNAVTNSDKAKAQQRAWKVAVASQAKQQRGGELWNPAWYYTISIGFSFHLPSHGNRMLDVENYLKPSLDALAAGLFCGPEQNIDAIVRYNFDDSQFGNIFIQRLSNAQSAKDEGAVFYVSVNKDIDK